MEFRLGQVQDWVPPGPVGVVVSSAVLHQVPGHPELVARSATALPPGGWPAVQVPGNFRAPIHPLLVDLCRCPERADRTAEAATALTDAYAAALRTAHPPRLDGTTLLPFRRVFTVGTRPSRAWAARGRADRAPRRSVRPRTPAGGRPQRGVSR
ncbi:hypothetical protein [Blastococcus sp. SYSU DS0533]